MRPWTFAALALVPITSATALAEAPDGERHYLGTRHHIGVEFGFGLASDQDTKLFGMQPILSGRYAATKQLGIEAILPFTFVSISGGGESESDFRIGNPYIGVDYRLFGRPNQTLSVKLGVGLPVASFDEDSLSGVFKSFLNYTAAWASRGFHRFWLYFPDTLTVLPQLRWAGYSGKVFTEAQIALPIMIETSEQNEEVDMVLDILARVGYDFGTVTPFLGFTGFLFLTADQVGDDDDIFQGGIELGALIDVTKKIQFDVGLHFNIDDPFGSSFDDDGFIGFYFGATFQL